MSLVIEDIDEKNNELFYWLTMKSGEAIHINMYKGKRVYGIPYGLLKRLNKKKFKFRIIPELTFTCTMGLITKTEKL